MGTAPRIDAARSPSTRPRRAPGSGRPHLPAHRGRRRRGPEDRTHDVEFLRLAATGGRSSSSFRRVYNREPEVAMRTQLLALLLLMTIALGAFQALPRCTSVEPD